MNNKKICSVNFGGELLIDRMFGMEGDERYGGVDNSVAGRLLEGF